MKSKPGILAVSRLGSADGRLADGVVDSMDVAPSEGRNQAVRGIGVGASGRGARWVGGLGLDVLLNELR